MTSDSLLPTLTWRLHAVMANRGIKSAKDLMAALDAKGITLSVSTVSRLVYKEPKNLSLELLNGLCAVLQCTPNDLLIAA